MCEGKKILSQKIKHAAAKLGFEACGIAPSQSVEDKHIQNMEDWLHKAYHGSMQYMERNKEKRINPSVLVESAKSVICLALNYHQKNVQPQDATYKVSQYAYGKDYHFVIKEKLYQLVESIKELSDDPSIRIFTDSAPVMERYWAQKAGLGWMGKNSCLILPRKGSFFFLAEIISQVELEYDEPFLQNYCGNCSRCISACPTGAIVKEGCIDAKKCLSYLTIESKEDIPDSAANANPGYVFGCDICQEVCPHNIQFAAQTSEPQFSPLQPLLTFDREGWEQLGKTDYKKQFIKTHSALARTKYDKFKQNLKQVTKGFKEKN